jgi:hypothetical protein
MMGIMIQLKIINYMLPHEFIIMIHTILSIHFVLYHVPVKGLSVELSKIKFSLKF